MEKSVFLYVTGDGGDYGAMYFEEQYDPQKVYEEMLAEGVTVKSLAHPEYDDEFIDVAIREFGAVDDEFVFFVFDQFCDYDALKAANIYRVEPK